MKAHVNWESVEALSRLVAHNFAKRSMSKNKVDDALENFQRSVYDWAFDKWNINQGEFEEDHLGCIASADSIVQQVNEILLDTSESNNPSELDPDRFLWNEVNIHNDIPYCYLEFYPLRTSFECKTQLYTNMDILRRE